MMKKRFLSVLVSLAALICVLGILSFSVSAKTDTAKIIHSGKSGSLTWCIKDNGEFILEGDGSLAEESYGSFVVDKKGEEIFINSVSCPWLKYKSKIVHAKIRVKNAKSLSGILSDCYNLETVDFTGSDTSKTINLACMFSTNYAWDGKTNKIKHIDLSMLDTSRVICMTQLFWGCTKLETVNLSGWDTSNVTEMTSMFDQCLSLKEIDGLKNWDTSNVTQMHLMFQSCQSLEKLDLSNWNTSKLRLAYSMFSNCENLQSLDVSTWDVSNIENFSNFFSCNTSLTELDLTKWNTKSALYIDGMFGWCYKLSGGITLNSKIQSYESAFYAATVNSEKPFVIKYHGKCSESLAEKIRKTNGYNASNLITEHSCANGHVFDTKYTVDKAATTSSDGSKSVHCILCGISQADTSISIPKIASCTLSYTKATYSGSKKTPSPKVVDSTGKELVKNTDYTVSYGSSTRSSVGRYSVKVKFKGDYSGSKTLYFTIVPKAPSSVTAELYGGYDDVKITWNNCTGASGYCVYYKNVTADGDYEFLGRTTNRYMTTASKDVNLKDGVKYRFKVVPYYYNSSNDTRYLSINYATENIYTLKKLSAPTVTTSGTTVRVEWENISGATGYQIFRSSSASSSGGPYWVLKTDATYVTLSVTKGTPYYYKVRAYKIVTDSYGNNIYIYAPWSAVTKYAR